MTIDMHSHHYGGLIEALRARASRPNVTRRGAGASVLNAMTASTVLSDGYTDIPARMAYLDRAGIERQLITFPGALGVDVLPAAESVPMVCNYNDELAEICRQSRGRLIGLGGLPLADIAQAVAEMGRLRRSLGLIGAIVPGNYFLSAASAERLRPVLAAANAAGALLMVHPGLMPGEAPPELPADAAVLRASALNLQASLSHMVLTLATNGFPQDYPDITFQVVNLGGTMPFIMERIDAIAASRDLPAAVTVDHLRHLVYDCASLGPRAIELAVKVIGADRIMLGTDYPIFEPADVGGLVASADMPSSDRAAVRTGTASAIIAALG